jgi:pimeloyl-ACP methyl ester carboxylesterase
MMATTTDLPDIPLPATIRSRTVGNINGLSTHVLEAGFETRGRPCVLLLHGFPELAFSWRKVMPQLAASGYHVIAPDQRGYGRTTGWDANYDGDLASFRLTNLVRDALGLVSAFGYKSVDARARFRLIGRRMVRAAARFLLGRDDERAVAAPAAALQHRRWAGQTGTTTPAGKRAPAGAMNSCATRRARQRRHAPRAAGRA